MNNTTNKVPAKAVEPKINEIVAPVGTGYTDVVTQVKKPYNKRRKKAKNTPIDVTKLPQENQLKLESGDRIIIVKLSKKSKLFRQLYNYIKTKYGQFKLWLKN